MAKSKKASEKLNLLHLLGYGCGDGGGMLTLYIVSGYLTRYVTNVLKLDPAILATMLLIWNIWDAVNDPMMGTIVDKTRSKWGKCRPYLKWMAIPIGIMTILCFLPVFSAESVYDGSKTIQAFVTIAVIYIVWSVVYTIADVPYWGLSTCLTNNTVTRGNILTVARMFCTVGAGIVTVFVPMITGALTEKYKYSADDLALIMADKADAVKNMVANQGITAEAAAMTQCVRIPAAF